MDKWDANKFLLHVKSEHTIDGERFDLEIQVLHAPNDPSSGITEEEEFSYDEGGYGDDKEGGGHRRRL